MNTQTNQERPKSLIPPGKGAALAAGRMRRASKELNRRLATGEEYPSLTVFLRDPDEVEHPFQSAG